MSHPPRETYWKEILGSILWIALIVGFFQFGGVELARILISDRPTDARQEQAPLLRAEPIPEGEEESPTNP